MKSKKNKVWEVFSRLYLLVVMIFGDWELEVGFVMVDFCERFGGKGLMFCL